MAWPNAANGWIHFVAAREDCYYTDSLCRLTLRQKLEWTLREKGYNYILRIEAKKGRWRIKTGTAQILSCGDTQKEFQKFLEENKNKLFWNVGNKTAILSGIDTFTELFTKEMGTVCEQIESFLDREGIFVVILPPEEERIERLFTNDAGILSSDFFLRLRKSIEQRKAEESVFEVMERELGEQFFLFPKRKKQEIQNMLFRGKVLGEWNLDCKQIEKFSDFLFVYLYSSDFREALHHPLPQNQKMPLRMLERELSKKGTLEKLEPLLKEYWEEIQTEKQRWTLRENKEAKKRKKGNGSFDILKQEGILEEENCVELPLYYMMTVQYDDGRRNSFFYPGYYRIPEGKRVRQLLFIRKKEHGFQVKWKVEGMTWRKNQEETQSLTITGICQAQILSYCNGMSRYLLQEERYQDTLSFQQLIEEETFLEEMLRKQIGAIFSEESNSERIPDRQRVEQRLNQKWIYRNGICFFEFYIKEIKKEK